MKKSHLFALLVLISTSAFPRSTKGKEFWIGFMENLSLSFNGPPVFKVHISAGVATTCTLLIPFTGFTSTFAVGANQTYVFDLPAGNFHPFGDETTANNGIRISADDSVEVKAFHHRMAFSESSLILPLQEIGAKYLVMAQPDQTASSPTEFVVLATQNNTPVEIIPSVVTVGTRPAGVAFTTTLQMGQMYQIQAYGDLTGTSVRSLDTTKKIAVFGGARQAMFGCTGGADDHLYDQLYPVSSFGTNYHVIPFSRHSFDVVKVLALQNNTTFSVTGGTSYNLNAGQCVTFTINASCEITSRSPISVAQFATSNSCNPPPTLTAGDPGMINLVPVELDHKKTVFYTPSTIKYGPSPDHFSEHRLNIVIKTSAIGNLTLDNAAIPQVSFSPVTGNPNYSYTRLLLDTLTTLQHTLACDSGFNATIYSFGYFSFYGHHLGYNTPDKPVSTVGLRINTIPSSLAAFPIPAEQSLTLKAAVRMKSVRVIDLFGKEVLALPQLASAQVDIDLTRLAEGVYYCIVQYEDPDRATEVVKFVRVAKE